MRIAILAAAILAAPAAARAQATDEAAAVLAAAKAASGGAAWDRLAGSWERGRHGETAYETSLDFRRLAFRFENTRGGATRIHAFDGETVWDQGPDGVKATRDPAAVREAITTAFVSNNGYVFPDRFPARAALKPGADAAFDVVEIQPAGGRPFELWFDRETRLPARLVDRTGSPPVAVELSDYRPVGDVRVAFRATVKTLDGKVLEQGVVEAVEHRAVPASAFAPPRD